MSVISQVIEKMKRTVNELAYLDQQLVLPIERDANVIKAFDRLRAAIGSDSLISITASFSHYSNKQIEVEWTVYDGNKVKNHSAKNLGEAVNCCLHDYRPPITDPTDDAVRIEQELAH